jgi:predicted acetyltransferase
MAEQSGLALIEPTIQFESELRAMISDYLKAGEYYEDYVGALDNVAAYIHRLQAYSQGQGLPPGYVPATTYWLVADNHLLVAESHLRHRLNASLATIGGHIGYRVRPSMRRRGYGTRLLALTLAKAAAIGLDRVLVTCDSDNLGSARIIEANGGVLTRRFPYGTAGKVKLHYWIEVKPQAAGHGPA